MRVCHYFKDKPVAKFNRGIMAVIRTYWNG